MHHIFADPYEEIIFFHSDEGQWRDRIPKHGEEPSSCSAHFTETTACVCVPTSFSWRSQCPCSFSPPPTVSLTRQNAVVVKRNAAEHLGCQRSPEKLLYHQQTLPIDTKRCWGLSYYFCNVSKADSPTIGPTLHSDSSRYVKGLASTLLSSHDFCHCVFVNPSAA